MKLLDSIHQETTRNKLFLMDHTNSIKFYSKKQLTTRDKHLKNQLNQDETTPKKSSKDAEQQSPSIHQERNNTAAKSFAAKSKSRNSKDKDYIRTGREAITPHGEEGESRMQRRCGGGRRRRRPSRILAGVFNYYY
uniref:Uncharacterized protein n=1 Tax=Oryza brachyantha TaxID=4533 RepID=J3MSB2_ORYBR